MFRAITSNVALAVLALALGTTESWANTHRMIRVSPTILATAYSSGSVVTSYNGGAVATGTGAVEVPGAIRTAGISSRLVSVSVVDRSNQKGNLDLYFFSAQVTPVVNGQSRTFSLTKTDASKLLGVVSLTGTSYASTGVNQSTAGEGNATPAAVISASPNLVLRADSGRSVYVVPVQRGSVTYVATDDLIFDLGVQYD